jgi:hypothetical protein
MMFMLNDVTPRTFCETLSVNVAEVDCPAFRTVFSLSHATLICPAATVGFHDAVVMLNVIGALPVFFT